MSSILTRPIQLGENPTTPCGECCELPVLTMLRKAKYVDKHKCGFPGFLYFGHYQTLTPPVYPGGFYKRQSRSGGTVNDCSGVSVTCTYGGYLEYVVGNTTCVQPSTNTLTQNKSPDSNLCNCPFVGYGFDTNKAPQSNTSGTTVVGGGSVTWTLSQEDTTEDLIARAQSVFDATSLITYPTPVSFGGAAYYELAQQEASIVISTLKYKLRHNVTKLIESTGYFRVTWIERVMPGIVYGDTTIDENANWGWTPVSGGASITSVDVLDGGLGYVRAQAQAFRYSGTLGIQLITEDTFGYIGEGYPFEICGNGYSSAPVVTISPPAPREGVIARAATATATVENGNVTDIAVQDQGEGYLPTEIPTVTIAPPTPVAPFAWELSPTGKPEHAASGMIVLGPLGNIIEVAVTDGGECFQQSSYQDFFGQVSPYGLGRGARCPIHAGEETEREYVWDGSYPVSPETCVVDNTEYDLDPPEEFGLRYIVVESVKMFTKPVPAP